MSLTKASSLILKVSRGDFQKEGSKLHFLFY